MRIGYAQDLEQTLHATILAPAPMQRIEADIGLHFQDLIGQIAPCIDFADAIAMAFQRLGTALAGHQTDRAFGAPAAL